MKSVKEFVVKNKKVLVRCDFNIPINAKGQIEDDFRIKQTIPTIEYLVKKQAKVILMSHLGEPKGKKNQELSLSPVGKKLSELLGMPVILANDCLGRQVEKQVDEMESKEVILLENLRFRPGEEENSSEFARGLAKLADIYINDAFGVCHRKHASVCAITEFLPFGSGLLLEKELKVLSGVLDNPWRPLVAIIGGAKISSKSKMIKEFMKRADHVLLGGKVANTVLEIKEILLGRKLIEEERIEDVKNIELTSTKLHIPIDAIASPNEKGNIYVRGSAPGKVRRDELILDIGPETIDIFSRVIKEAKMIVWSGPMGLFENPKFASGTKGVAEAIVKNHKAYKIVGGGDTISAISKLGLLDKFDHVSTGGGAMLSFLSREKLPGLEALGKR